MKFNKDTLAYRIIIKPETIKDKQKTKGSLLDLSAISDRTQAVNSDRGTIFMIGPKAFKDYGYDTPPIKVGDKVYYAKYGAKVLKDEDTEELYIICNDEDILVGYK